MVEAMTGEMIRRETCTKVACWCNAELQFRPYRKEFDALLNDVFVYGSRQMARRSLLKIDVCADLAGLNTASSSESLCSLSAHASDRSGLTGRHNDCRRQTQAFPSVAA